VPDDAFSVEGQFGKLAIFDLDRGDKATPKNRVVVGDQVVILGHTQPFSLKGRLRPFLDDSLSGSIVKRALAPNERAFLWFAPADLDVATLLSMDKKAMIAPAVAARVRGIAERLMAEVDLSALQQLAREIFGVHEEEVRAGFVRPPAEWEILHGSITEEDRGKALHGLANMTHLENDDLARALGASVVRIADRIDELPESIEEPERWLRFLFHMYGSSEYVVRPQYRAASELVADAALVAGVPALADTEIENLPNLWLDGDAPTASPAITALCVQNLRLATDDGSIVAPLREPLTLLWETWPRRFSQILSSWRPASRDSVAKALDVSGMKGIGAICPATVDRLLALVAQSLHLVAYALKAFEDDPEHPLCWRRYAVPSASGRETSLQVDRYRDAVLLTLAAEIGASPEAADAARLQRVSERLSDLADQVEKLIGSDLAGIRSFGCTDAVVSTVERPLRAALAAMRAATAERLAGGHAAVELMLSALIGAGVRSATDEPDRAEPEE
jgi:hypothetical protein